MDPNEYLEIVAKRAFTLSQTIEQPHSLDTDRGLCAIHKAHESLKAALREAGFYGAVYVTGAIR